MRQLIVELSDAQMRALETSARIKQTRPEALIAEQLRSLMPNIADMRKVSVKQYTRYRASRGYVAVREKQIPYRVIMHSTQPHNLPQEMSNPANDRRNDLERRKNVLQRTAGIWKNRQDTPKDGLQFQLEARSEWD